MPEKETLERAARDRRQGKAPSTQAGEFVREEIEHIREGKHGARSTKQAIAIGLSKARRAGVPLKPPRAGRASTRRKAAQDVRRPKRRPSPARSRAATARAARGGAERGLAHRAGPPGAKERPPSRRGQPPFRGPARRRHPQALDSDPGRAGAPPFTPGRPAPSPPTSSRSSRSSRRCRPSPCRGRRSGPCNGRRSGRGRGSRTRTSRRSTSCRPS